MPSQEDSVCLAHGIRTVGKSPENPWAGLIRGRALEFRALVSAPPAGIWPQHQSAAGSWVSRASGGAVTAEVGVTVPGVGLVAREADEPRSGR